MTAPVAVRARSPLRPAGPVLFASGRDEERARRPTDLALAIAALLVVITASVLATLGSNLDGGARSLLTEFPPFLDPLWEAMVWAAPLWGAVLLVVALVRR